MRATTTRAQSQLMAYLQLFRLPNVFTAAADVLLGFTLTHNGTFQPGDVLAVLIAASCLMYLAGMVLNDVFDRQIDALERPHRPIPSGRVHPAFARTLGLGMLAIGAGLGALAGAWTGDGRSGLVALSLAAMVLIYDRLLKQTPLGPLAMGACRMLNVLLGMSASMAPWTAYHVALAGSIGIYITGVTWLARTEASLSSRVQLALATLVMATGLALAASHPYWPDSSPGAFGLPVYWLPGWIVLAGSILWRPIRAVMEPSSANVQDAVRNCILSLIIVDAVLAIPAAGLGAMVIVLLILPTRMLARYIYST